MDFVSKVFRGDRVIWTIFLLLCIISIIEVYSASSTLIFYTDYWKPISRHVMFLLLGTGLVLITHVVSPSYFGLIGIVTFPFIFGLLAITRFFGVSINGSSRWLDIGGLSFQPSEIAKLSLIGLTAFCLSKKKSCNEKKIFYIVSITTFSVCSLIIVDNGSTAVMLVGIVYLMLLIGQISFKRMFLLGSLIVFLGVGCFFSIKYIPTTSLSKLFPRVTTWKSRFLDFKEKGGVVNSRFTINDGNYQIAHANIAISNGGIFGKGPGKSIERDFLPQAYSDFIYAVIIEETGLVGGFFVLFLYIVLFVRSGIIASRSEKLFSKYIVMGSSLLLITQTLANMAVAVSLIPVTGQTLPLISRGGTSTLVTCICFGIILSVSRYKTSQSLQENKENNPPTPLLNIKKENGG